MVILIALIFRFTLTLRLREGGLMQAYLDLWYGSSMSPMGGMGH